MNSIGQLPGKYQIMGLIVGLGCLLNAGCGGDRTIYPVSGKVVDMDGQPIPGIGGHTVEFDAVDGKSSALGSIQQDGSFRMTTTREGDGAWVGKQRVLISRASGFSDVPAPRVIAAKYEDYATSGLTVEVKRESNQVEFKVQALKKK